jgi:hypothetical protein
MKKKNYVWVVETDYWNVEGFVPTNNIFTIKDEAKRMAVRLQLLYSKDKFRVTKYEAVR